jgi:DnaJ-class molecular chaperone
MRKAHEILRVAGKGVAAQGARGDLLIRLEVALPHKLSSRTKESLEVLKSEGL